MLKEIKSKYILVQICSNVNEKLLLKIIKHNKKLKSKLNISLNDYKNYGKIVIELIPIEKIDKEQMFINYEEQNESLYHINFINDEKDAKNDGIIGFFKNLFKKKNCITQSDNVRKIIIIIDNKINSLKGLFKDCICLKEINFIKFNNNHINDMSELFSGCISLEKLNILKMKTDNVTNMKEMFYKCQKLRTLNLKNFKMNNVTSMRAMFYGCSALEDLNFLIFDTSNVIQMNDLFYDCFSLHELNIYNTNGIYDENEMRIIQDVYPALGDLNIFNFNTSKVTDMSFLFNNCYSLKKFHIINFDTSHVKVMNRIFMGCKLLGDINLSKFVLKDNTSVFHGFNQCSKSLINNIKKQIKNINKNAFGGK